MVTIYSDISVKDACIPNPCKNNGKCMETPEGGFRCICENGYTGMNCEKRKFEVTFLIITVLFSVFSNCVMRFRSLN